MGNIVKDTYTEASTTALPSHTPDTGTSWTEVLNDTAASQFQVNGTNDNLEINTSDDSVSLAYSCEPDPSSAEYVVEIVVTTWYNPGASSSAPVGLFARRTDNDNHYSVQILPIGHTSNLIKIFKEVSTTRTELASANVTGLDGSLIQFIVTDAKKSVRMNGVEVCSTTDNALTSAGDCGVWTGDFAGDGFRIRTGWALDDFRSYDIPQEANPDSDVSLGNWTDEASGTTNIYGSIDETTASESDYVESGDTPSLDVAEFGLSNPSDPSTGEGHYVHFRYRKQGGETIDLRVRLLQGATEIASWTYTGISDQWIYKRELLTTTQANNISDYTNLRVEFRANKP